MACHCFSATTPTKLLLTTTFTNPGMLRTELSSTLSSVAPTVGGRTTRPCIIPGMRMFCTYVYVPMTLSGMSILGTVVPTILY